MNMEEQFRQFLEQQSTTSSFVPPPPVRPAMHGGTSSLVRSFPMKAPSGSGWIVVVLIIAGVALVAYWVYKKFFCSPPSIPGETGRKVKQLYPDQPPLPVEEDLENEYPVEEEYADEHDLEAENDLDTIPEEQEDDTKRSDSSDPNFTPLHQLSTV